MAVGVGGFFGAVLRFGVSSWIQARHAGPWPVGTWTVNVVGCFLIGLAMAWVDRGRLPEPARLLLVTGLLGALTTFSTFGWETLELLRRDLPLHALGTVFANVAVGLALMMLGLWLGRCF